MRDVLPVAVPQVLAPGRVSSRAGPDWRPPWSDNSSIGAAFLYESNELALFALPANKADGWARFLLSQPPIAPHGASSW